MSGAPGPVTGDGDVAELVDVANIPLTDLVEAHGDSPVLRSLHRLRQSLDDPNGVLSAFSSFISE